MKDPAGCGGTAIKAELLEKYVTGAVQDALGSPRVQEALRQDEDRGAACRAELLAEINAAQERRKQARRDYSDQVIDRVDWLDIRQPPKTTAPRPAANTTGSQGFGTVLSDIPSSHRVRDAWKAWSTDRIRAVLHRVIIKLLPAGVACNPRQQHRGQGCAPRTGNGDLAATRRIRLARFRRPEALSRLRWRLVSIS